MRIVAIALVLFGLSGITRAEEACEIESKSASCDAGPLAVDREIAQSRASLRIIGKIEKVSCGELRSGLQEYLAEVKVEKNLLGKTEKKIRVRFYEDRKDRSAMPAVHQGELSELELRRENGYLLEIATPISKSVNPLPLCEN